MGAPAIITSQEMSFPWCSWDVNINITAVLISYDQAITVRLLHMTSLTNIIWSLILTSQSNRIILVPV